MTGWGLPKPFPNLNYCLILRNGEGSGWFLFPWTSSYSPKFDLLSSNWESEIPFLFCFSAAETFNSPTGGAPERGKQRLQSRWIIFGWPCLLFIFNRKCRYNAYLYVASFSCPLFDFCVAPVCLLAFWVPHQLLTFVLCSVSSSVIGLVVPEGKTTLEGAVW